MSHCFCWVGTVVLELEVGIRCAVIQVGVVPQSYMMVELDWNSKEWKEVSQLFLKTAQEWATIRTIYRIQNPRLWQKFAL